MKRIVQFGLVLALVLTCSGLLRADVLKIVVEGPIHPITDEYIGRALDAAKQNGDAAILIELSTPGGLADSTRTIVEKILSSPVPVIVYVAPSGSRAASAGFFILQAADVAAMAPATNTGAAHPVAIGGGKIDEVMKEKIENDSAAFMRAFVAKRGRNLELAEAAVRQSKSFTDQEALAQKLIDVIASNQTELLQKLEGREVTRFNGTKMTLHLAQQRVREFPMTLKQRILGFIMDPNVAFILLAVGLLALYAEFNHPGAILPGVVGLVFILLAVFAFNILPTRVAAVVLILVAFALFALEAKFAAHGVLGAGGVALMTIGALLLVDSPIPEMRVRLVTALSVSVPIGMITIFLVGIALRARRSKITTGPQGMIGEVGVARTALTPRGQVFVHGEIWNAVANAEIAAGDQVQVKRVDGLTLEVERARKAALSPQ